MANRLVEHLRERGRTAGASFVARWFGPVSPAQWRRAAILIRTQPVGRIVAALAAAFVFGIVIGIGVAAVITPQRAAVLAGAPDAPGRDKASDAAPYAVAVRVREEGRVQPASRDERRLTPEATAAPPLATTAAEAPPAPLTRPQVQIPHVQVPLPAAPPPGDVAAEAGQTVPGEHPYARPAVQGPALASPPAPAAAPPTAHNEDSIAPNVVAEVAEAAPAPPTPQAAPPHPVPKNLELAALPMPRDPAWIRNAVTLPEAPRDAVIAIIIDDMGIDQKRSRLAIGLPAPLTLSFIPYGYHLQELAAAARAAGHEVMLHMPMEPLDAEADPGPNALRTTVSIEENRNRLLWAFGRLDGIVGLNNHMGSKFTTWQSGMEMVMREAQARGLLFVDSITNNESVGYRLAHGRKLPAASRDVFIDHDITAVAIVHSLQDLERVARRKGYAVGIAHPHDLTRELLKRWIVEAKARGIDFVPISHIARRAMKTG